MATTTIKSTYSLDVETVCALEALARRWNVSKSEALRRAVRAAAVQCAGPGSAGLEALDALQGALDLSPGTAARWQSRVRAERRAGARRFSGK